MQHYERIVVHRCLRGFCTKFTCASSSKKQNHLKNKFSLHICFQYWHDPIHADQYVEKSQFIAEINNEREVKNLTYAENLVKLENFVMVKFADVSLK